MFEFYRDKLMSWLLALLLVVVVVGAVTTIWPVFSRRQALTRQNAELDAAIAEKRREIDLLKENQRRFQTDPDFIEHIARQNRRVFPGELVFVFDADRK